MAQEKKPTIEQRMAEARAAGFREGFIAGQLEARKKALPHVGIINYQED